MVVVVIEGSLGKMVIDFGFGLDFGLGLGFGFGFGLDLGYCH
jgi:hypothetical protein